GRNKSESVVELNRKVRSDYIGINGRFGSEYAYSPNEQDYIRRVAGKVPAYVMASTIGRTRNSLVNWANRHGISLRVPYGILKKHWPEYAEKMTKGGRNGAKER
ncbi:hypothetical protein, partial [Salmonella enterica]